MLQGSVKPWLNALLNLPPWMRYQAEHMLVQAIIPYKLKDQAARKYYNFAADYEMNRLYREGVDGVRVVMFGTSLDSPGRRELLNMQLVSAYYCCPFCLHTWQPGPLRKVVHGGYRRFLPIGHPMRAKVFSFRGERFEFRDVEHRRPPVERTDSLVALMVARARPNRPFMGHKGDPFLQRWIAADWGTNMPDKMHDIKCFTECVVKCLVGRAAEGFYTAWNKDDRHRKECEVFGIFDDFVRGGHPSWRLTRNQVKLMDKRVRSMWWSHYTDKLCYDGHSFWTKTDRMWKASHKSFCLLVILPTCLRGFVKATHLALLHIVDALRRLDGQTVSVYEAKRLGVAPGLVIDKRSIAPEGLKLIVGLLLLEGAFPVSHMNPNAKHFTHYGGETKRVGNLRWVSMPSFERCNKRLKGLVRSNVHPETSLANTVQMDIATRFDSLDETLQECSGPVPFRLSARICGVLYIPSKREQFCLSLLGVKDFKRIRSYPVARIQGEHFACGEWGKSTCGSVFTTVYCGHSVYGVLGRFLQTGGELYAAVTWLSKPVYPYAPLKLVVRVKQLPKADQPVHRCVISCDRIDPTPVYVMPDEDGIHYYMMREKGFNR